MAQREARALAFLVRAKSVLRPAHFAELRALLRAWNERRRQASSSAAGESSLDSLTVSLGTLLRACSGPERGELLALFFEFVPRQLHAKLWPLAFEAAGISPAPAPPPPPPPPPPGAPAPIAAPAAAAAAEPASPSRKRARSLSIASSASPPPQQPRRRQPRQEQPEEESAVTPPRKRSALPPCPICLADLKNPSTARCGHVCCLDCWRKCLAVKLECPVCKRRTRLGQLVKLFLVS